MRLLLGFCLATGALGAQDRPAPALSAGPLGAWTLVPALPGMGRAVDIAATTARRQALLTRIGRGVVLIPAANERDLETDYVQDNDFRQHNTFFYFTQLEAEDAWLLMSSFGPDSTDVILFLPARNPAQERWTGVRRRQCRRPAHGHRHRAPARFARAAVADGAVSHPGPGVRSARHHHQV